MASVKGGFIRVSKATGLNRILRSASDRYEQRANPYPTSTPPAEIGWSIIILTDGKAGGRLGEVIGSATRELSGTPSEVLVVGPPWLTLPKNASTIPVRHIPYREWNLWSVPGGISRKKNLGARYARYDKLAVAHDYIGFELGWRTGYETFGDFTIATNILLNQDGSRHLDWVTWDYPNIGQALVPYSVTNLMQYQYLSGMFFAIKRDFFIEHPLDEHLRWGEGEDVEWSKHIRGIAPFKLNTKSTIKYCKEKPRLSERWRNNTHALEQALGQS